MHKIQSLIELAALVVVVVWLAGELLRAIELWRRWPGEHEATKRLHKIFYDRSHKGALLLVATPSTHIGWRVVAAMVFGVMLGMLVKDESRYLFPFSRRWQLIFVGVGLVLYGGLLAALLTP
jgi:undecaprenyl pyrophosphate phosphatase UppP